VQIDEDVRENQSLAIAFVFSLLPWLASPRRRGCSGVRRGRDLVAFA
jgi:hypothetical protein